MRKRNVLDSPGLLELKKRRHKNFLNKILISFFGFATIVVLSSYLSRLGRMNISEIKIVGNKITDAEKLKAEVEKQIAGKYFWFFPKTNILLYPQETIKTELQNKFKRIKDINLSIKPARTTGIVQSGGNNKTLEIFLSERTASYTWCGAKVPEALLPSEGSKASGGEGQKCYFMDSDGYIFDEAPYFSGDVYFKFYGLFDLNTDNPLGFYFSKQNFKQLISFRDILADIRLKPVALRIVNNEDAEIILLKGVRAATEPKIIFKMNANIQNIAENLQAALNTEPLQSKFKNKYSSLQYIDLRFNNKVYDKFL